MIARQATPDDYSVVFRTMRPRNAAELYATRFHEDPEQLTAEFLGHADHAIMVTALCTREGTPAGLAGAWFLGEPGIAAAALILSEPWPQIGLSAFRYLRGKWIPAVLGKIRRAECQVIQWPGDDYAWLQWLGFEIEGVARCRGKNGENFLHCARINPTIDGPDTPLG